MRSVSSEAKAARDYGDAKRISESMVSVEMRLSSARARMSSDETSLIVRAATATTYEALKRSRADSGVGPSVPSASGLMTKDRAVARRILSVQLPLRRSSTHSSSPHCSSAFR